MTNQPMAQYRASAFHEVEGWVAEQAVDALEVVGRFHDVHFISGDAMEIGVFQGRFFLALMAALRSEEVAVAVDIFDDQALNVDLSGAGSGLRAAFMHNIDRFAIAPNVARILAADSMCIRPETIRQFSATGSFRLISIDGGHTAEHVINDLTLAAQLIAPGGMVFLDDFHSPHWPGVFEGFIRFMLHMNRNLAPVLFAGNKLILTTISHHRMVLEFLRAHFVAGEGKDMMDVRVAGYSYLASS